MTISTSAASSRGTTKKHQTIDAEWYLKSRRFAELKTSRVAYVEHGHGPVALFIHGFPLNGYQWRGALERLHEHRRCIAPDVMGLGFTETAEGQAITPETQVTMLVALLNSIHVGEVDLVANDSGGLVAQLFVAKHPERVRTLLLTNCDVDENNPPAAFVPLVELAKKGSFAEQAIAPQLDKKEVARGPRGLGVAYTYPDRLADETIEMYLRPLLQSPLKKAQLGEYTIALGTNELVRVREQLKMWKGSARMVWALKDPFFGVHWAEWLDRSLPGSRGVRRLEEANLFFPEEMPDLIAEEATKLWGV